MSIKKVVKIGQGQNGYDSVSLDWFDLKRKHLCLLTDKGITIVFTFHADMLENGDTLLCEDGYSVDVTVKTIKLYKLIFTSNITFAKTAYEIGIKHMQVNISENCITVPEEETLDEFIQSLSKEEGVLIEKTEDYFYPNMKPLN